MRFMTALAMIFHLSWSSMSMSCLCVACTCATMSYCRTEKALSSAGWKMASRVRMYWMMFLWMALYSS